MSRDSIRALDGSNNSTFEAVTRTAKSGNKHALDVSDSTVASLLATSFLSGEIVSPEDETYTPDPSSIENRTIESLYIKTRSGSCTVAIQINGVSITGLSAVAVSATPQEVAATALRTMVVGDALTLVVSSSSAPTKLVFRIKYTRTS